MPRHDVLTPEQRSHCMSQNRGRDTKPEMRLRKACFASGLRYRLSVPLPGKPDFVFPSSRVAVFVDGCFWHGCPKHYRQPRDRAEFWATKIDTNRRRDAEVTQQLTELGWIVVRVWEHDVKGDVAACVSRVQAIVKSPSSS